ASALPGTAPSRFLAWGLGPPRSMHSRATLTCTVEEHRSPWRSRRFGGERMDATAGEPAGFGGQLGTLRQAAGLAPQEAAERPAAGGGGALGRGARRRPSPHPVRAPAPALGLWGAAGAELVRAPRKRGGPSLAPPPAGSTLALPIPATPLVGRAREIVEIGDL